MQEIVCIIPAFNPDEKLVNLIDELQELDFWRIVVVNDGSQDRCRSLFKKIEMKKCTVLHHQKNLGKGEALKTAFRFVQENYPDTACITVDSDGQHKPEDVLRLAEYSQIYPEALILGVRNFSGAEVPLRSRIGNGVMSFLFKLNHHFDCPDTQTGLRLIPGKMIDLSVKTEGSRYEYEMNFLNSAAKNCQFRYVPIETVYENNNEGSHFRPVEDSLIILRRLLRFSMSSAISTVLDLALFSILWWILPFSALSRTWAATVLARSSSGVCNYALNRYWAFGSGQSGSFYRYVFLWTIQMLASAFLTSCLQLVLPVLVSKILVDGSLFFISYWLQKNWVFGKKKEVVA